MPNKIFFKSCAAILALGMTISATPVKAGFEWITPNTAVAPSYQPPVARPPQVPATTMPEVISPVVISGELKPIQAAAPYAPPVPLAPPETLSISSAPPNVVPVLSPPGGEKTSLATATISTSAFREPTEIVQGFASQIPLSLALRQILPVSYNFVIDASVDRDILVSYKGGKSWRQTLNEMLTPVNLTAHEEGLSVSIGRVGIGSSMDQQVKITNSPATFSAPAIELADGWTAMRGDTLHKVLSDWCQHSNVELQWQAEYDYPVEASAHFEGKFEDAVRGLLAGFDGARPQPVAELHANRGAGQRVLVVQARGNSYSN